MPSEVVYNLQEAINEKRARLSCAFCGKSLEAKYFPYSPSRSALNRGDDSGVTRLQICKTCAQKFYDYMMNIYGNHEQALFEFCVAFNVYYDDKAVSAALEAPKESRMTAYFAEIRPKQKMGKTFADNVRQLLDGNGMVIGSKKHAEEGLSDEDLKNRREILTVFHYDPFEKETVENKKKLYRDLVTMADPAMVDDLVRQRAAIEIVRSFARIDDWTETINSLSKDPQQMIANAKEIKSLIETKNKETDMVTKFSKDHGFAERYASAKSRGAGTLGATMRDMEEYDYDDGKVNLYDIKTSATMQQAADISTAAIMKQLALSEADYVDLLKQQREKLVETENELMRTKEELRLVYKQVTKQDLLRELATDLMAKGLDKDEVAAAILAEIHYDDGAIKKRQKELAEFMGASNSKKTKKTR